jgi:hypothetical protein
MPRAWVLAGCLAAVLLQADGASGQTIRPLIVEHGPSAKSYFEVVNRTLHPQLVTLEARGFTISEEGVATFGPLPDRVQLRLSEMSFRVPPRQSHYVFYEAKTDSAPAWFTIYANVADARRENGLRIDVELPHTVYLVQKEPLSDTDVQVRLESFDPRARTGRVRIENTGPRLGRVADVRLSGGGVRASLGAFPLLPRSSRLVPIAWEGDGVPEKLTVEFTDFSVMRALVPTPDANHVAETAKDRVSGRP